VNVLHVYSGNLWGGIETLFSTLADQQYLCPRMYHHFALCFDQQLAVCLRAKQFNVHILGNVFTRQIWTVWKARRTLAKLLQEKQFEIVICHSCWSQAIFGPVVKAHHIPLVFFCHDTPQGNHWLELWAKLVAPDLSLANSHYTQSVLPKLYPKTASCVWYLPVTFASERDRPTALKTVRAELAIPEDQVVIIQVSRMETLKGHAVLLKALAKLKHLPSWNCWIVGGAQRPWEQAYLRKLQAQAQTLQIAERVKFLGERQDVPQLLLAADIYCQPNIKPESFGITFVEALYANLPIVTTAIGAAPEIVAQCGKLMPARDDTLLVETLRSLILHPDQRESLSSAGRSRAVELCEPKQQLEKLAVILEQVILKF
jgi:glycosyltransferase involved in cell wall biosynthesis